MSSIIRIERDGRFVISKSNEPSSSLTVWDQIRDLHVEPCRFATHDLALRLRKYTSSLSFEAIPNTSNGQHVPYRKKSRPPKLVFPLPGGPCRRYPRLYGSPRRR